MTLKQRLEAVWQHERIACSNHLARWNEKKIGYSTFSDLSLWYVKGTSKKPKQKKVSKGYTFLTRNYRIATMIVRDRKEALAKCTCSQPHHLPVWYCATHGQVAVPMD